MGICIEKICMIMEISGKVCMALLPVGMALASCTMTRAVSEIAAGAVNVSMYMPEDITAPPKEADYGSEADLGRIVDTDGYDDGEPLIMNAIREMSTGEMVATDVISASRVVARFRNVAERNGIVSMEFDIDVPPEMIGSGWKLKLSPKMETMGQETLLEPLYVTGRRYREAQMRGYERYAAFVASIITDSARFIRISQLEKFLERYFPETYAMKSDTSFISSPEAENLFGVSQLEALDHYTRHGLMLRNENRRKASGKMFSRYVKDPVISEGIRLDTVMAGSDGGLRYRYVQTAAYSPGMKKIVVSMDGEVYAGGRKVLSLRHPDSLTFYVSSLSSLVDDTPRYRTIILSRTVYDNTSAFIDFRQGCSDIDTLLEGNSSELSRVRRCIRDISGRAEYILDSMVVTASCSPEGAYALNSRLAGDRAAAVLSYIRHDFPDSLRQRLKYGSVPENWDRLLLLAETDTLLQPELCSSILSVRASQDKDSVETILSSLPGYRYLREKIYPKLRNVRFEFWLHRPGQQKDTVHTEELDSTYMAGVAAIRDLDYRRAVALLQPYSDYNSALACLSAGYEDAAVEILSGLSERSAKAEYLAAVALARLDREKEAEQHFFRSIAMDPALRFRANLDPELSQLVKQWSAGEIAK